MKKITAANGDNLVYVHPVTIVFNVFLRNGTYSLMFISRVDNRKRLEENIL